MAQGDPNFKECFLDSLEPVKVLLSSIFQRLQLKEDPFQVFMAASDAEIEQLWNNILSIDNMLTQKDTTKKALKAKKKITEFIEHCCHVQHVFGIKKCGDTSCKLCKAVRMPHDNYLQDTSFSSRPTCKR